jgi:hypothetical protein
VVRHFGRRPRSGMRFALGESPETVVDEGEDPCRWALRDRKDGGTRAAGRRSQSGVDPESKRDRRMTLGRITCADLR